MGLEGVDGEFAIVPRDLEPGILFIDPTSRPAGCGEELRAEKSVAVMACRFARPS